MTEKSDGGGSGTPKPPNGGQPDAAVGKVTPPAPAAAPGAPAPPGVPGKGGGPGGAPPPVPAPGGGDEMASIAKAGQPSGGPGVPGGTNGGPGGKSSGDAGDSKPGEPGTAGKPGGGNKGSSEGGGAVGEKDSSSTLGPGGTAMMPADGGGDTEGNGKKVAGAAGAAAAVPAAAMANQLLVIMAFLNYLKNMLMAVVAVAQNFLNMAMSFVMGIGKSVMGFVGTVGNFVTGVIGGGSTLVAGAATVTAGVVSGALVIAMLIGGLAGGGGRAEAFLIDCGPATKAAINKVNQEGDPTTVDAKTLENAKTVYGVLSAWGMPNENIAGILGNWDAESKVDPTSVQNNFSSPQVMTSEKESQAKNTDNGIGLGQWTFERNTKLRAYADKVGKDWWTLEAQLGFMISADEGGNADIVKGMISKSEGSPGAAAIYFHDKWERSADTAAMAERRKDMAVKWMGMFGGWSKNQTLADSILKQSGSTVDNANKDRVKKVNSTCKTNKTEKAGALKTGGLTLEEAQKLMDTYLQEGEGFLRGRYGNGGPGDCGFGKADNCVGFSIYFANKFTSMQQYAMGNGIDTAGSVARVMGKETSSKPTPYSIASGPGSGAEGHTFVVLGIQGDQAVIGEANCGTNHKGTVAKLMPLSQLMNGSHTFVDVSDSLLPGVSMG